MERVLRRGAAPACVATSVGNSDGFFSTRVRLFRSASSSASSVVTVAAVSEAAITPLVEISGTRLLDLGGGIRAASNTMGIMAGLAGRVNTSLGWERWY